MLCLYVCAHHVLALPAEKKDLLDLELRTVFSSHVDARNQSSVLCREKQLLSHLSSLDVTSFLILNLAP